LKPDIGLVPAVAVTGFLLSSVADIMAVVCGEIEPVEITDCIAGSSFELKSVTYTSPLFG
jgi:hypothetical protein